MHDPMRRYDDDYGKEKEQGQEKSGGTTGSSQGHDD
jgi:hypothetical protein